jgi:hypothetical protein
MIVATAGVSSRLQFAFSASCGRINGRCRAIRQLMTGSQFSSSFRSLWSRRFTTLQSDPLRRFLRGGEALIVSVGA